MSSALNKPTLDLQFRKATIDEAASLCDFARRIFIEAFGPDNDPEHIADYVSKAFTPEKIRDELADPQNVFILAEHESAPVAYYKLQLNFDRSDSSFPALVLEKPSTLLERFYVDAHCRGHGVAHQLMTHCIQQAQLHNKAIIFLGVWEHNLRALKFYQKWDFTQIGTHTFVLGDKKQLDYWMGRSLSPLSILEINEAPQHLENVRKLFQDYQISRRLPLDFQGFDQEIVNLPGKFVPPFGALYLALWNNQPMGCVAFYELEPGICELKRLFVKPEAQGRSLGRSLMERAIADAREAGHQRMRLDSLRRFEAAGNLYPKLGFYEIPPYNENPYEDVYYMERVL